MSSSSSSSSSSKCQIESHRHAKHTHTSKRRRWVINGPYFCVCDDRTRAESQLTPLPTCNTKYYVGATTGTRARRHLVATTTKGFKKKKPFGLFHPLRKYKKATKKKDSRRLVLVPLSLSSLSRHYTTPSSLPSPPLFRRLSFSYL